MDKIRKQYKIWEQKYKIQVIQLNRTNTPVNFKESLQTPIHRWMAYKEGFSPNFVKTFIKEHKLTSSPIIFDPFGGVGTTVLAANELGFDAFSTDVNPLGNFASRVKSYHYSDADIQQITNEIRKFEQVKDIDIQTSINNDTVKSYFYPQTFASLLKAKSYIFNIDNEIVKNIFTLSLLSIVESISTHRKDGNGLKIKKQLPDAITFIQLRSIIINKVNDYIADINSLLRQKLGTPCILDQSCIIPYQLTRKADIVITSPPYANCFDYSKVYMCELWVGGFFDKKEDQQTFRENSVSSHVHYKWKRVDREYTNHFVEDNIVPLLQTKNLWNKSIITMLPEYFSDLGRCLYNLSQNLNDNATVGFVVGNSAYAGVPVPTDLILADIAENIGYNVESIDIYRKLTSSSQQMAIIKEDDKQYLRESLVILKWQKN